MSSSTSPYAAALSSLSTRHRPGTEFAGVGIGRGPGGVGVGMGMGVGVGVGVGAGSAVGGAAHVDAPVLARLRRATMRIFSASEVLRPLGARAAMAPLLSRHAGGALAALSGPPAGRAAVAIACARGNDVLAKIAPATTLDEDGELRDTVGWKPATIAALAERSDSNAPYPALDDAVFQLQHCVLPPPPHGGPLRTLHLPLTLLEPPIAGGPLVNNTLVEPGAPDGGPDGAAAAAADKLVPSEVVAATDAPAGDSLNQSASTPDTPQFAAQPSTLEQAVPDASDVRCPAVPLDIDGGPQTGNNTLGFVAAAASIPADVRCSVVAAECHSLGERAPSHAADENGEGPLKECDEAGLSALPDGAMPSSDTGPAAQDPLQVRPDPVVDAPEYLLLSPSRIPTMHVAQERGAHKEPDDAAGKDPCEARLGSEGPESVKIAHPEPRANNALGAGTSVSPCKSVDLRLTHDGQSGPRSPVVIGEGSAADSKAGIDPQLDELSCRWAAEATADDNDANCAMEVVLGTSNVEDAGQAVAAPDSEQADSALAPSMSTRNESFMSAGIEDSATRMQHSAAGCGETDNADGSTCAGSNPLESPGNATLQKQPESGMLQLGPVATASPESLSKDDDNRQGASEICTTAGTAGSDACDQDDHRIGTLQERDSSDHAHEGVADSPRQGSSAKLGGEVAAMNGNGNIDSIFAPHVVAEGVEAVLASGTDAEERGVMNGEVCLNGSDLGSTPRTAEAVLQQTSDEGFARSPETAKLSNISREAASSLANDAKNATVIEASLSTSLVPRDPVACALRASALIDASKVAISYESSVQHKLCPARMCRDNTAKSGVPWYTSLGIASACEELRIRPCDSFPTSMMHRMTDDDVLTRKEELELGNSRDRARLKDRNGAVSKKRGGAAVDVNGNLRSLGAAHSSIRDERAARAYAKILPQTVNAQQTVRDNDGMRRGTPVSSAKRQRTPQLPQPRDRKSAKTPPRTPVKPPVAPGAHSKDAAAAIVTGPRLTQPRERKSPRTQPKAAGKHSLASDALNSEPGFGMVVGPGLPYVEPSKLGDREQGVPSEIGRFGDNDFSIDSLMTAPLRDRQMAEPSGRTRASTTRNGQEILHVGTAAGLDDAPPNPSKIRRTSHRAHVSSVVDIDASTQNIAEPENVSLLGSQRNDRKSPRKRNIRKRSLSSVKSPAGGGPESHGNGELMPAESISVRRSVRQARPSANASKVIEVKPSDPETVTEVVQAVNGGSDRVPDALCSALPSTVDVDATALCPSPHKSPVGERDSAGSSSPVLFSEDEEDESVFGNLGTPKRNVLLSGIEANSSLFVEELLDDSEDEPDNDLKTNGRRTRKKSSSANKTTRGSTGNSKRKGRPSEGHTMKESSLVRSRRPTVVIDEDVDFAKEEDNREYAAGFLAGGIGITGVVADACRSAGHAANESSSPHQQSKELAAFNAQGSALGLVLRICGGFYSQVPKSVREKLLAWAEDSKPDKTATLGGTELIELELAREQKECSECPADVPGTKAMCEDSVLVRLTAKGWQRLRRSRHVRNRILKE